MPTAYSRICQLLLTPSPSPSSPTPTTGHPTPAPATATATATQLRVMFLKRINPNRVHLSADLVVDAENNSTMTVGAEYSLKQSKLHMSMDSNMLLKSYLETQVGGGVTLQFCAEMKQSAEHFRFGYGLQIM